METVVTTMTRLITMATIHGATIIMIAMTSASSWIFSTVLMCEKLKMLSRDQIGGLLILHFSASDLSKH